MNRFLTVIALSLVAVGALAGVAPGDKAPDFQLADTAGHSHDLAGYLADGKIVVLEWFNADCPFIKKHHANAKTMDETYGAYADRGVVWLAINSSAPGKQGAGLERNQRAVDEYAMTFPVLMDSDGTVGKAYGATATPHMFVITPDGKIAYAGAIDDDRSAGVLGKTNYVALALDAILAGKPVPIDETKAYGCSVKY